MGFEESAERPRPVGAISELVAQLLKQHGVGSDPAVRRAVAAWREAAGREFFEQTRVTGFRGGVLSLEVDSAALLQELAVYRKRELLLAARRTEPAIVDLKFRSGSRERSKSRHAKSGDGGV